MKCNLDIRSFITKEKWRKMYSKYRYMGSSQDVTSKQHSDYMHMIEECEALDSLLWCAFWKNNDCLNRAVYRRLKRYRICKKRNKIAKYTTYLKKCKRNKRTKQQ